MTRVAQQLNREYFRGNVDEYDSEALMMWNEGYQKASYLNGIANDTNDYRVTEGSI